MQTFRGDDIRTLMQLGLTSRQARVYLTLVRSGISTVSAISDVSKIKREDLYRVIATLFEAGLVKKKICRPLECSAVPLRTGISMLLEQKNRESYELVKKANDLVSHVNPVNSVYQGEKAKTEFALVPKKNFVHTRRYEIEDLRESIDAVISWKTFLKGALYLEDCKKALCRGVRIRVVVEKSGKSNSIPKWLRSYLMTSTRAQVKFTDSHPSVVFSIHDNLKTLVLTSPEADFPESDTLVSTNISVLRLAKGYFDMMWNDSSSVDVRVAFAIH